MRTSRRHWGMLLVFAFAGVNVCCSASESTESRDDVVLASPDSDPNTPVICNEQGCFDGVGITIRTTEGPWLAGTYSVSLTDDEATHDCQMSLPGDLPERGSTSEIACDPALGILDARLSQDASCMEQRTADAIGESCAPVPDHYTLSVFLSRTPEMVSVAVSRDGESLAEVSKVLEYVEHHPNGEGCEPTCRGASVKVTLK